MESSARSQSNLVVRPLHGFSKVQIFSNLTIPMFWAEYVSKIFPFQKAKKFLICLIQDSFEF